MLSPLDHFKCASHSVFARPGKTWNWMVCLFLYKWQQQESLLATSKRVRQRDNNGTVTKLLFMTILFVQRYSHQKFYKGAPCGTIMEQWIWRGRLCSSEWKDIDPTRAHCTALASSCAVNQASIAHWADASRYTRARPYTSLNNPISHWRSCSTNTASIADTIACLLRRAPVLVFPSKPRIHISSSSPIRNSVPRCCNSINSRTVKDEERLIKAYSSLVYHSDARSSSQRGMK